MFNNTEIQVTNEPYSKRVELMVLNKYNYVLVPLNLLFSRFNLIYSLIYIGLYFFKAQNNYPLHTSRLYFHKGYAEHTKRFVN